MQADSSASANAVPDDNTRWCLVAAANAVDRFLQFGPQAIRRAMKTAWKEMERQVHLELVGKVL
jgi:hypothetical protein